MKKIIIVTTMLCMGAFADQTVPQSGDVVQIGDFQFMLLSPSDYEQMRSEMSRISGIYAAMNSNETGRAALHGRAGHRTVTNGVESVQYADGYVHSNVFAKLRKERPISKASKSGETASASRELTDFEKRLAALRRKRREALTKTNEVTVTVGGGK